MGLTDAAEVLPVAQSWVHDLVVDRVEAGVIAIVWVKERQDMDAVEVGERASQQLLDLAKVSANALGVNQDAGTRHVFLRRKILAH